MYKMKPETLQFHRYSWISMMQTFSIWLQIRFFVIEYEASRISSVYMELSVKYLNILPIEFIIKVKPIFRNYWMAGGIRIYVITVFEYSRF